MRGIVGVTTHLDSHDLKKKHAGNVNPHNSIAKNQAQATMAAAGSLTCVTTVVQTMMVFD